MRRHEVAGVIGVGRVDVIAAGGLEAYDGIAIAQDRKLEAPAIDLAFFIERVFLGLAPAVLDIAAQIVGELTVGDLVVGKAEVDAASPHGAVGEPIGRPRHHRIHQRLGVRGRVVQAIAGVSEEIQHMDRARRRIEAHAIGEASVLVGIVGEDQRHAPVGGGFAAQFRPRRGEGGHKLDPVAPRLIGGDGAFGGLVEIGLPLEADGAGDDAAIDLGKRHVHRDIAGGEARLAAAPRLFRAAREDHLKDWGLIGERRGKRVVGGGIVRVGAAHGEGGAVEDHRGGRFGEKPFQRRGAQGVFQRGHENRQGIKPRPQERFHQPIDRMQTRALNQCTIENHRHDRRPFGPSLACRFRPANPRARPIDARPQEGRSGGGFLAALQHRLGIAQEVDAILRPALDEIGPEGVIVLGRNGRELAQLGIGLVIPRQRGERHARLVKPRRILLESEFPIARPAQNPRDHQPRAAGALIQMQVDRHRVLQVHQAGEPEGWRRVHLASCARQSGQFGVGGRDHHDVGRGLPKVDRFLAVVDIPGGRCNQVHQIASCGRMAFAAKGAERRERTRSWITESRATPKAASTSRATPMGRAAARPRIWAAKRPTRPPFWPR